MTQITYHAVGDVRGPCGHNHRSVETAQACADLDAAKCAALPGGHCYSDRRVQRTDGQPLDDWDREMLREYDDDQT